jgi:hypothetical protein
MLTLLIFFSQFELFEPKKVFDFAEYLRASGDYAAAINEYNRYQFLGDTAGTDLAPKIIDCLIHLQRFEEALSNARSADDSGYWQGIVLYHSSKYDSARYYLACSDQEFKIRADRFIGLSYAAQFDFDHMKNYIDYDQPLPSLKKPWLGGLLSTIPGAGHAYANRLGDGLFSFLTIAMLGAVSYYYYQTDEDIKFGVALSATAVFYAGSIYGGVNAVRNYNFYKNSQYLNDILDVYSEFDY